MFNHTRKKNQLAKKKALYTYGIERASNNNKLSKIKMKEEKHSYVQGKLRSELLSKWLNIINHQIEQENTRVREFATTRIDTNGRLDNR